MYHKGYGSLLPFFNRAEKLNQCKTEIDSKIPTERTFQAVGLENVCNLKDWCMGREEDQERALKDYLKSDAWKTVIYM